MKADSKIHKNTTKISRVYLAYDDIDCNMPRYYSEANYEH